MKLIITFRKIIPAIFPLAFLFLVNLSPAQTQTPSPALLVLNKEDATLSIIDPATRKTVAQVPTGEGPHEIAASNDGKFAFVANYGARSGQHDFCDRLNRAEGISPRGSRCFAAPAWNRFR